MTGPSLSILRYGVKPTFPAPKPVPARIFVGVQHGRFRWVCTVCRCRSVPRATAGAAADAGRLHLRQWHS